MNKFLYILICCSMCTLVSITTIAAPDKMTQQTQGKNTLKLLENVEHSTWQEKDNVLREIQLEKRPLSDVEKKKLLEMFDEESKFQQEYLDSLKKRGLSINEAYDKFGAEYLKKGYLNYFSNYTNYIYTLKDVSAIPSILRGLHYYGGAIVPTHVIGIGESAVQPLLDLLGSQDKILRNTAFFVLSVWVNAPMAAEDYSINNNMLITDSSKLSSIKTSFLEAINDKDSDVRLSIVYGLGAFPDEIVLRKLEDIANNDPYLTKYSKKYQIREEAKKSIKKIKAKLNK